MHCRLVTACVEGGGGRERARERMKGSPLIMNAGVKVVVGDSEGEGKG